MTRKDYELIAASIRDELADHYAPSEALAGVEAIAHGLAQRLKQDNARFARARFLKACGVAA